MSRAGDHFETQVLKLFNGTQFTGFSNVYLTLSSQNPKEDGSGLLEPGYQGYKRMPIAFTPPAPLNNSIGIMNLSEIKFPEANVSGTTCEYIALYDSASGGNMLIYSPINGSGVAIEANKQPTLRVNEAKFWITGNLTDTFKTWILNTLNGQNILGFSPYATLYSGEPDNGGVELSGGNFARASIAFGNPTETANGQKNISNVAIVEYPVASQDIGAYNVDAVMSAQNSGQCLTYVLGANDEYKRNDMSWYDIGDIVISIN